jgi:hypothetical protein
LVLTWFRAYDAEAGRWLSADPIGEAGGMNLYGYVGGDPMNAWDVLGLYDSIGSYFEEVGDFAIGELKGAAENLSFGLYNPCYKNSMQASGGGFGDGLATVAQLATGVGGLKVGLKQGLKKAGKEFSHWVPARYFRNPAKFFGENSWKTSILKSKAGQWFKNSGFNGSLVSALKHFKHDAYRYPKGWRDMGPRYSRTMQQLSRVSNSLLKTLGGFGYAAGSHAARSGGGDCP